MPTTAWGLVPDLRPVLIIVEARVLTADRTTSASASPGGARSTTERRATRGVCGDERGRMGEPEQVQAVQRERTQQSEILTGES